MTDNAANMAKMRRSLGETDDFNDTFFYGGSAHILNLLANDLQFPESVNKRCISLSI